MAGKVVEKTPVSIDSGKIVRQPKSQKVGVPASHDGQPVFLFIFAGFIALLAVTLGIFVIVYVDDRFVDQYGTYFRGGFLLRMFTAGEEGKGEKTGSGWWNNNLPKTKNKEFNVQISLEEAYTYVLDIQRGTKNLQILLICLCLNLTAHLTFHRPGHSWRVS